MGIDAPRPETTRSGVGNIPHRWERVDDHAEEAVVASYATVVAGAGPAGLTAAYELTKNGHPCVVLEAESGLVGGISRTDQYKGYRFDIGGHRFFSKSEEVNRLWREILGDELIERDRLSRIYYNRKFFYYPLKPFDALSKLGIPRATRMVLSYFWARLRPIKPERSYEDWLVNRFGRLLFETFFKTYTEKVWGMSTDSISPDWAAQRVKGLDLFQTVLNAFLGNRKSARGGVIKTLIDRFQYPRLGPGQMWEAARDHVRRGGGAVHMDRRVGRIEHDGTSVTAFVARDSDDRSHRYVGRNFLSTLPIRHLIAAMSPKPPAEVVAAANALKYRDFLTVVLIVDEAETFPDNWIYIHEPEVKVGRVQNFKNWSPDLVPDPARSSLGLEYFCFEGDDLWTMADADLIALGTKEIDTIGLVKASRVVDGCVVRMPKAYPVYDEHYIQNVAIVRKWLSRFDNLELAGRNGMHKYNNQDHSMMTALLAARNILGIGNYDTWKVNTDAEYHEQETEDAGRAVPKKVKAA